MVERPPNRDSLAAPAACADGERIARVELVPPSGRLGALDYRIPEHLEVIRPGCRVLVPLGSKRCMGLVVSVTTSSEPAPYRLRDVIAALDESPLLGPALLRLIAWMADYYLVAPAEAASTALPGALRIETEKVVERDGTAATDVARPTATEGSLLALLEHAGAIPLESLRRSFGDSIDAALRRLRRCGAVRVYERFVREVAPTRYEISYSALANRQAAQLAKRPALRALYDYIAAHPGQRVTVHELQGSFANASGKVRQLVDLGLLRGQRREIYRQIESEAIAVVDHCVELNAAQSAAVTRIVAALDGSFSPFLLLGVTGSGKTEVYLRAIATALARGNTALILVPEISLTHQIVGRVRARFGDQIAVLHSGLGAGERWDEWRRLARGEARIAIGARSAVFAPLADLGLIIVDEEHDGAYKQSDGLHYNARDVAVMRAKFEGCALVLGSATASLESLHNARGERYHLLRLPERVAQRSMPSVELIDLRGQRLDSPLSPQLAAAIEANLAGGGQTLLFLNRRGFAPALQCRACGEPVTCPNCSISLTWHQRASALRCHYCDFTCVRPVACGQCELQALDTWGWGTERLEAFLRQRFAGARIARMDRDTTGRKGSLAALLRKWNSAALDILIGTQMVTKGHDVAGVTLVGVVMADLSLNIPDFRSAERAFQQLAQVAGRAGRGDRPGRVLVQTLQPEHHVLRAVVEHDFVAFAERDLRQREELGYPPFGRLVLLRFEGEDAERTRAAASKCADRLRAAAPRGVAVLGPAPAPLARLRGRYRWQILLRGKSGATLRRLAAAQAQGARRADRGAIRTVVDVDPQSLM